MSLKNVACDKEKTACNAFAQVIQGKAAFSLPWILHNGFEEACLLYCKFVIFSNVKQEDA